MKNNDLYIKLLEYGFKHSKGFTVKELINDLKITDLEKNFLLDEIQYSDVVGRTGEFRGGKDKVENQICFLSLEQRSKYLDYLEFKEAKKAGKEAKTIAIISIIISILIGIIQIIFAC